MERSLSLDAEFAYTGTLFADIKTGSYKKLLLLCAEREGLI
jgi:hypothetical protein